MNAGAFGKEIGPVVETVRVARAGRVVEIPGSEVKWNYRHTSFQEGELLLGATLVLHPGDAEEIRARMEQAKGQRLATQPHGARSAGCFFKNPPAGSIGPGKMIDPRAGSFKKNTPGGGPPGAAETENTTAHTRHPHKSKSPLFF